MRHATAVFVVFVLAAVAFGARERGAGHPFLPVYRVLQHPRCMNCHPAGDHPLHGDDSHPHTFGVKRGTDGKGLETARCSKCHRDANQPGEHQPPGAPQPASAKLPPGTTRWQLPAPEMPLIFEGRSAAQLCRQLLDPKTNGGRPAQALIAHVQNDPLVNWGWNPGEGRTHPPGTHEQFVHAVRAWIEDGPTCPAP